MNSSEEKSFLDKRVREYIIGKVKEKFPEDFHLVEHLMDPYIKRYNLKEIITLISVEIERIKWNSRNK